MPDDVCQTPLTLIGASVRAAAWSARRAGFRTLHGVDLFADRDAARLASMQRLALDAYPSGLEAALATLPVGPVVYTGALENQPCLIAALAKTRPIWGNTPATLRAVRDPASLEQVLRDAGLPALAVTRAAPSSSDRCWLSKPLRSGGGLGIVPWDGQPPAKGRYLQERVEGMPASAIFCGLPEDVVFLGCTRQLVGQPWTGASGFQYCGSIGPFEPPERVEQQLREIGRRLVERFRLRGLFGVDVVLNRDAWVLEVNPRYTASIEVLERSTGLKSIAWHAAAFVPTLARPALPNTSTRCCGKAIVFARRDIRFPTSGPWEDCLTGEGGACPVYADIPNEGETIGCGQPILTVFAEAEASSECIQALKEQVAEADHRFT